MYLDSKQRQTCAQISELKGITVVLVLVLNINRVRIQALQRRWNLPCENRTDNTRSISADIG